MIVVINGVHETYIKKEHSPHTSDTYIGYI